MKGSSVCNIVSIALIVANTIQLKKKRVSGESQNSGFFL